MASMMLSCSICPKRPNFSDTSHLLTHVGSKGHLAHLHTLQVRSHQEIAASHQLATYNQWYQQHGLGQLLSERMQQKESKAVTKRTRPNQSTTAVKQESVVAYGDAANFALVSPSRVKVEKTPRQRRPHVHKRVRRRGTPDTDSDYESSPIKQNRRRKVRMLYSSPVKRSNSQDVYTSDADCPAEDDPPLPSTPENAKLKGVVWPGMDLFDAATVEMRRKRNQKKDGSVLKGMERTSAMIEPTEVIFSPGGTMRKQRYIDGMVDSSSPLNGETPMPKLPVRRKRQPLAVFNSNISRRARRSAKGAKSSLSTIFRDPSPTLQRRSQYIPSSSTHASFGTASRFSPTEDENMEFKLTVGSLTNRKKAGNFTIFNDNDVRYPQPMLPPIKIEEEIQPPQMNFGQVEAIPARSQLSFLTAPWLQPQHQLPLYYNNSYTAYRPSAAPLKTYHETDHNKENVEWTSTEGDYGVETLTANPLGYHYPGSAMHNGFGHQTSPAHTRQAAFGNIFTQLDDPFAYAKNPLSAAFSHFDGPLGSGFEGIKHREVSPDGTISDHEDTEP